MTALEDRIVAFVAQERGDKIEEIQLSCRLSHDLGMDGDDAVEFFEQFGKEFNVDLSALGPHWHEHFGPEGGVPSLGCMVVIGAAVVIGDGLHGAYQPIPGWLWVIVLLSAFGWIYTRFFTDREQAGCLPVTVADLVDAAKEGKWMKNYEDGALFRTQG